jgi:hypothetical protein
MALHSRRARSRAGLDILLRVEKRTCCARYRGRLRACRSDRQRRSRRRGHEFFFWKTDLSAVVTDTIPRRRRDGRECSPRCGPPSQGAGPGGGRVSCELPHRVSTANLLPIHRLNWGTCVMTRLHQGWFMSAALLLVALFVLAGIGVTVAEALRSVRPVSRVNAVFDADYVQGLATRGIVKVPGR